MTRVIDILLDSLDILLAIFWLFGKLISKAFHFLGEYPFAFFALVPFYAWGIISQSQMDWLMFILLGISAVAVFDHDLNLHEQEEK